MTKDVTVKVLEDMKVLLTENGWTKGEFVVVNGNTVDTAEAITYLANNEDVEMCVLGAGMIAAAGYAELHSMEWEGINDRVLTYLQRAVPNWRDPGPDDEHDRYVPNQVSTYNDAPGRTIDQIMALIDEAIRQASLVDR